MEIMDSDRAIRFWNRYQSNQASAVEYDGFDNLSILKDSSGRVLGAITPDGEMLSQDDLTAYRVMASCRC